MKYKIGYEGHSHTLEEFLKNSIEDVKLDAFLEWHESEVHFIIDFLSYKEVIQNVQNHMEDGSLDAEHAIALMEAFQSLKGWTANDIKNVIGYSKSKRFLTSEEIQEEENLHERLNASEDADREAREGWLYGHPWGEEHPHYLRDAQSKWMAKCTANAKAICLRARKDAETIISELEDYYIMY